MRLPPQNGVLDEELEISPTCHGYSLASVVTPPTILETRLGCPHLQFVRGGAVVGACVVAGGEGGGMKKHPLDTATNMALKHEISFSKKK